MVSQSSTRTGVTPIASGVADDVLNNDVSRSQDDAATGQLIVVTPTPPKLVNGVAESGP